MNKNDLLVKLIPSLLDSDLLLDFAETFGTRLSDLGSLLITVES